MTPTATQPFIPMTREQRAWLVCWLKDRDLWDDRHAVCGVSSLTALSKSDATELIDRFKSDRPGHAAGRKRLARLAPGTIRPATNKQRVFLNDLLGKTGWTIGTRNHWLWSRYHVRDVYQTPMTSTTAHQIITVLQQVIAKKRNPDSGPGLGTGTRDSGLGTRDPGPRTPDPGPRTPHPPF